MDDIDRLDVALVVQEPVRGELGRLGQEAEVAVVVNGRYRRARLLREDRDGEAGSEGLRTRSPRGGIDSGGSGLRSARD